MAHPDLVIEGSLSPSRVMDKSPMPITPPAGYLPERPCSTTPDDDSRSPPGSPPKDSYSRQNPFGLSQQRQRQQQQQSPEDDEMNTRGGGRNGGICEVLLAACCCYALCEICC